MVQDGTVVCHRLCPLVLLLDHNADFNIAESSEGRSPLWQAAENGHLDIVKELLSSGADVNTPRKSNGSTPLRAAAFHGHSKVAKLVIEKHADINKANSDRTTPLFIERTRVASNSQGGFCLFEEITRGRLLNDHE